LGDVVENIANIFFDFNDPVITDPSIFSIDVSAGVEEGLVDSQVRIFPNPSTGSVYIESESPINMFTVHGTDGRLILTEQGKGLKQQYHMPQLKQGMYLIKVSTPNGIVTQRLMIQR